jgi:predicted nucleic acid-binding protein
MTPVLLDTGVIVALLDRRESRHLDCSRTVETIQRPIVTCEAVIMESCHLLSHIPGASARVLDNVATGIFEIRLSLSQSAANIAANLRKYHDMPASMADSCLIHMADELNTGDILTLDSDFRHYRWRKTKPFNLLIPQA